MFRGNCPTRLDEKGRLKLPADFKHEIDENYSDQFYITSLDGAVIRLYPLREWEQVEQKMAKLPSSDETLDKFLDVTAYYGQLVSMDAQGRLTISDRLRNEFGLKGEVAVIGKLRYIEIRLMEEYRAYVKANHIKPADKAELRKMEI
jgi:MraZ protein